MTIRELKRILNAITLPESQDLEVKVWLPGSTISLSAMGASGMMRRGRVLLIEGNIDDGSALMEGAQP
jgi:hypothetical protein